MNYTKLITKKKQYKYSVNIGLDLREEPRLTDFIPNATTTEILREYLGGLSEGMQIRIPVFYMDLTVPESLIY